jgi:hypothetical protein
MYSFSTSCPLPTKELFPGSNYRFTPDLVITTNSGDQCIASVSICIKSFVPEQNQFQILTSSNHIGYRAKDITNIAQSYQFIN